MAAVVLKAVAKSKIRIREMRNARVDFEVVSVTVHVESVQDGGGDVGTGTRSDGSLSLVQGTRNTIGVCLGALRSIAEPGFTDNSQAHRDKTNSAVSNQIPGNSRRPLKTTPSLDFDITSSPSP